MIRTATFSEALRLGIGRCVFCADCGRMIDHMTTEQEEECETTDHTIPYLGLTMEQMYPPPNICWECRTKREPKGDI